MHIRSGMPSFKQVSDSMRNIVAIARLRVVVVQAPIECHQLLSISGTCRLCLVRTSASAGKLVPACATTVSEGLEIETAGPEIDSGVVHNLRLIRCRHPNACMTCEANGRCEFQSLVQRYQVQDILPHNLPVSEKKHDPIDNSSFAVRRDMAKCVLCSRCVRACSEVQGMNILGLVGRGAGEHVTTFGDVPLADTACISCGQCTAVCPVGALTEQLHIHDVEYGLQHKRAFDKVWVATTAPAVRIAISEEFDYVPGTVTTGKLVSSLRELGFDYEFDHLTMADLTIVEEATEFLRRLKTGGPFPMFTSCCPGWINLVEKCYPALMPYLSTCKSPQGMMGALLKSYFAQKIGVPPERIMHVSCMPCVAKKDEIKRPQLHTPYVTTSGQVKLVPETDFVLTTRELARMVQRARIPFSSLPDSDFDQPLGLSTGAAALFAATGGVMEAALRTAAEFVTGQPLQQIEFHAVRGVEGIRDAQLQLGEHRLRVAVAHGTKKVRQLVEQVLAGQSPYHLIEVMACPGGCVGGGGEPRTGAIDPDVIRKRIAGVHAIDRGKPIRKSHENPAVKALYSEFLGGKPNKGRAHSLLHTHYTDRSSTVKAQAGHAFGVLPPPLDSSHEY